MKIKRRQFIGAATLGVLATGLHVQGQDEVKKDLPAVPTVPLTKEIKCSRIGFGTGMRGGNRQSNLTRHGREKGLQLLHYAYDHGVRFFDCADLYGTHQIVADAMTGKPRDSYTIVSKIWVRPGGIPEKERPEADIVIARFLKELKTDYIDVLQIHCMDKADWTTTFEPIMEQLEKLKQKGMIRSHGISSHSNVATELAAKTPWTDTVHIRINSEGMNMDGPKDDAAARVAEGVRTAKLCKAAGQGIIAMKVVGEGKMAGDAALRKKSAAFVKSLDCVDVMIVGFDEIEHIAEFIENAC